MRSGKASSEHQVSPRAGSAATDAALLLVLAEEALLGGAAFARAQIDTEIRRLEELVEAPLRAFDVAQALAEERRRVGARRPVADRRDRLGEAREHEARHLALELRPPLLHPRERRRPRLGPRVREVPDEDAVLDLHAIRED